MSKALTQDLDQKTMSALDVTDAVRNLKTTTIQIRNEIDKINGELQKYSFIQDMARQ